MAKRKIDYENLGGWNPNPHGVEAVLNDSTVKHPVFRVGAADVIANYEKRDTHLWMYLEKCFPGYRRGAQQIGSCVAWGGEIVETILCCKRWLMTGQTPIAQVATEANYGLCRVEALGKSFGGWNDGAYGAAMAKAAQNYGCVLRVDHSKATGNSEHNLTRYSGKKEKDWGAYGCGGQNDQGLLDAIAKEHPVKTISQVNDFDDIAASIAGSLCPVTIASNAGFGNMRRDKYGQCYWTNSWSHQMAVVAVRFGERPAGLIAQSWGPNSASGPSGDEYTKNLPEGGTLPNILGFTWWCDAETLTKICKTGDCWAYGDVDGWEIQQVDLSQPWNERDHLWV